MGEGPGGEAASERRLSVRGREEADRPRMTGTDARARSARIRFSLRSFSGGAFSRRRLFRIRSPRGRQSASAKRGAKVSSGRRSGMMMKNPMTQAAPVKAAAQR